MSNWANVLCWNNPFRGPFKEPSLKLTRTDSKVLTRIGVWIYRRTLLETPLILMEQQKYQVWNADAFLQILSGHTFLWDHRSQRYRFSTQCKNGQKCVCHTQNAWDLESLILLGIMEGSWMMDISVLEPSGIPVTGTPSILLKDNRFSIYFMENGGSTFN